MVDAVPKYAVNTTINQTRVNTRKTYWPLRLAT